MKVRNTLFLLLVLISTNAFAEVVPLTISNDFPSDGLMLENHIYKNAATFENLGVYEGTIYAIAVYSDAPLSCDPGYYLPENATECVICSENHYCIGGENAIAQSCPNKMVSPVGTTNAGACGKKLHVGEDIMYLTSVKQQPGPALAVDIGDKTYYAQMTPVSDGKKTMNSNTTRSMHIVYKDVEYTIHDATAKDVAN